MNKDRIFWGVCFILGAVLLITNQIWGGYDISLFKILITIICAAIIIKSMVQLNFWGILLPIALLYTVFYDNISLDISKAAVWGAAVLGSIGLEMIFKDHKNVIGSSENHAYEGPNSSVNSSSNIAGERIRIDNTFGHSTKYVSSDNFMTAKIDNSFGATAVYFDNAIIQQGRAEIKVDNAFGEINLYIPKNWKINNFIKVSFGAVRESGQNQMTELPEVDINGSTAFGNINIYYI